MAKFYETADFRALRDSWYRKLHRDGVFVDCEVIVAGEPTLAQSASNVYRQARPVTREAKLTYYEILSHHMAKHPPKDRLERLVMQLLSQGMFLTEIAEELRRKGMRRANGPEGPVDRGTLRFIVRRWETTWGIRHWSPLQLLKNTPASVRKKDGK
jgi:hypothetical protein